MQTPLRKKFGAVLLAAALFVGLCPLPGRAAATPGGARVADADTRNSYIETSAGPIPPCWTAGSGQTNRFRPNR